MNTYFKVSGTVIDAKVLSPSPNSQYRNGFQKVLSVKIETKRNNWQISRSTSARTTDDLVMTQYVKLDASRKMAKRAKGWIGHHAKVTGYITIPYEDHVSLNINHIVVSKPITKVIKVVKKSINMHSYASKTPSKNNL